MEIARIISIAMITTFAVLILKPHKPEVAALLSIVGGLMVILLLVEGLGEVISNVQLLVGRTGIQSDLFSILLRIIGIGYITEFAANICSEAGNQSMASKVVMAGKVVILVLALPIINNLIEIIVGVMP